jgi:hypothetical protein
MQSAVAAGSDTAAQDLAKRGGMPLRRPVVVASLVCVVLVVLAGVAMVAEPWFVLRRFGGEEYIPAVVSLEIARFWGAWGAAVVVSLHVTAVLHGEFAAVPSHPAGGPARYRFALLAAAAVPALFAPVCMLALGSSMFVAKVCLGIRPSTFFEIVELRDVLRGALLSLLFGLVPAAWSRLGARFARSQHRGLAFKLLMTWVAMLGISFLGSLAVALLGNAG